MIAYILGITNGAIRGLKIGQVLGTTNRGKRDYKQGQLKGFQIEANLLQIVAKRYQIGEEITNQDRDNKLVQNKSDQSLLHFEQQRHRLSERVLLIKSCIEQSILLLLFMSKILVILYCSFQKVFSSEPFSSF